MAYRHLIEFEYGPTPEEVIEDMQGIRERIYKSNQWASIFKGKRKEKPSVKKVTKNVSGKY